MSTELKAVKTAEDTDADNDAPEGIVRHDNGTSTVTLLKPVEHAQCSYEEVVVREAIGSDLIRSDKAKGDAERGIILISVIGGIPIGAVRKMKARDIERVMEEIDYLKGV